MKSYSYAEMFGSTMKMGRATPKIPRDIFRSFDLKKNERSKYIRRKMQ